jgi:CRP-like cAMP-binding protein
MTTEFIDRLAATLSDSLVFKGVSVADLRTMLGMMEPQTVAAGSILFRKSDPGDTMYVLTRGSLRIFTTDAEGNELTLADYAPVRLFGDFSMLDGKPRSASAQAVTEIEVMGLSRQEFLRLLPQCPDLGMVMIRNLTDRVRHITNYMNNVNRFVQKLAAGELEDALSAIALDTDDSAIRHMISTYVDMVRTVRQRQEAKS